jgi:hypothetical protein
MDTAKREVWRSNALLKLTRTEFSILECLMRAAGRAVTRDHLITSVWGERDITDNNIPFRVHRLPMSFEGFADFNTPKGKDLFGTPTSSEFLVRPQLKFDLSSIMQTESRILEPNWLGVLAQRVWQAGIPAGHGATDTPKG